MDKCQVIRLLEAEMMPSTPRGVFVDLEPTVIDEVRTGTVARGHYNNKRISALSINEFLKPAEWERNYSGGRDRGRGRDGRAGYGGGNRINDVAPAIEDVDQFLSLGVK